MERRRMWKTAATVTSVFVLILGFGASAAAGVRKPAKLMRLAPAKPLELLELRLRCHLMEEVREFYGEVLELPLEESEEGSLQFLVGSTRLIFEPAAPGQEPTYHFAIEVSENKVSRAARWLSARYKLLQEEGEAPYVRFPQLNSHSVYFSDPVGNFVELIGRHSLPTARPGEFSARDFLRISEVGLVVNRFTRVADLMLERLGIRRLPGPRSQQYGVFGDDHFSFVVVEEGLTWARTDQPARPYPITAVLRGESGSLLIADMPFLLRLEK